MSESTTPTAPTTDAPETPATETPPAETPPAPPASPPPATPAEAPKPDEPAKVDTEDKLSKGFAELTRREKKIRAEAEAHKGELAEAKAWADLKAKLKDDPSLFLSEVAERLGVSLDTAAAAYASKLAPTTVETRLEKLEKEKLAAEERAKAAEAKAAQDRVDAYVEGYRADIRRHVEASPDDFQALQFLARAQQTDVGQLVVTAAERHYQETGKVLEPVEAAKLVEGVLAGEIEERVKGLAGFARFRGLFGTPAAAPTAPEAKATPKVVATPRDETIPPSITNRDVAAGGRVVTHPTFYTGEDEAMTRALRAMEAAKKKKAG